VSIRSRIALAVVAGVAALAATAPARPAAPLAATKTCRVGYTHAVIAGTQKCLHAGEFCTHRYDLQYRRYGFRCIRYYANVGRYRLTRA
jgi:hypothetical protein